MANQIVHPEAKYKIGQIGPVNDWSFKDKSTGGDIAMKGYSIQLEGVADWVTLNQAATTDAPAVGTELEGHVEDTGKFGLRFVKKSKGGGGNWGGGKSSPGAQWSAAFDTATNIVAAYLQVSGKKVKTVLEFVDKVEEVAKVIKPRVDALAGSAVKEETTDETPKTTSESGESPATDTTAVPDVDDSELGKW